MTAIYLVLGIAAAYLITITPELYIQVGYIGVVAYSSFKLGGDMMAVALQDQIDRLYEIMQADYEKKVKELYGTGKNHEQES